MEATQGDIFTATAPLNVDDLPYLVGRKLKFCPRRRTDIGNRELIIVGVIPQYRNDVPGHLIGLVIQVEPVLVENNEDVGSVEVRQVCWKPGYFPSAFPYLMLGTIRAGEWVPYEPHRQIEGKLSLL